MQPRAEDLAALRDLLGDAAVLEHAAVDVDGCPLSVTLTPTAGDLLEATLALLSERRLPALVRGGGSLLALGNPLRDAALLVSTEALAGVHDFDPDDGVVRAGAGTRLSELQQVVTRHGWELPLDPPGDRQTLGGTLAAAAVGPRRLGFGPARDWVLGLDVILASGQRTRCGGRVVKNVTGYDLPKLYTGSFGTLGIIEAAWLRLHPLPECVMEGMAAVDPGAGAFGLGLEVARRPSARAAALVTPRLARRVSPQLAPGPAWLLLAEFAGDASTSQHDALWLERRAAASSDRRDATAPPESEPAISRIRALQGASVAPEGLRARIAVLPSALERCCVPLLQAGAELLVYPGLGLVYAIFELGPKPAADALEPALAAVERAVKLGEGSWMLEDLPSWAKRGRDVFGAPSAQEVSLMRALKRRFDPHGVLNPGRFCGGI
jgi:glycolate oxidase FAD binding subunit